MKKVIEQYNKENVLEALSGYLKFPDDKTAETWATFTAEILNKSINQAILKERERIDQWVRSKKWNYVNGLNCNCGREWYAREQHNKAIEEILNQLK